MTIYIDTDYKCHLTNDGTLTPVETDFFDGKCAAYIEGYRFVPSGSVWVRPDGVAFRGEMVSPWKPWRELDAAQRAYEQEQYQAMAAENATLTAENATLAVALDELDVEYQKGVDSL